MNLSSEVSTKIKYLLDNYCFPFLRDSYFFMLLPMYLCFSKKYKQVMEFKEKAPYMSAEEYANTYAETAPFHFSRLTDLNRKCLERLLKDVAGTSALDIGCGRCFLLKKISEARKMELFGMDLALSESADVNENKFKMINGTAENIPLKDKSIDTVICTHVLEHVIDLKRAISEIRRVAKKRIIIVVPCERPYKYTFSLHLRFFPYIHSFLLEMMPFDKEKVTCEKIGGDIYYLEDL